MDDMNKIVAKNVRRLREDRKLSMDELVRLSGISKSMLAQIERGDANPTVSTLWKISNGLKVPFDALTVRPKPPYEVVRSGEIQPLAEDEGRAKNYPIFPDDENRRFAVYYLEVEPGGHWAAEPHLPGTVEFISVFIGTLELHVGETAFVIGPGEHIRFNADEAHTYRNIGPEQIRLHMILYNP